MSQLWILEMLKGALLLYIGAFIFLEAIIALAWPNNDKSIKAQSARGIRLICGIMLLVLIFI